MWTQEPIKSDVLVMQHGNKGSVPACRYFWSMPSLRSIRWPLGSILLACVGCTAPDTAPRSDRYGGVFNLNETEHFRSIHPLTLTQASAWRIMAQVYEGLVRFDPHDLSVKPALAERWEVDHAGLVYTFHLRPDVRFHDDAAFTDGVGREVTADDVLRCFGRICTAGEGDRMFWLFQDLVAGANKHYAATLKGEPADTGVEGIEAVDQRTVRITLMRPSPIFLMVLAHSGCWIHPPELTTVYADRLTEHAIGTGPFRFRSAGVDEAMVLERWSHYWGRDAQGGALPYLDAVRVTFDQDKNKEFDQFLAGHITMVDEVPLERAEMLADTLDPRTGKLRFHYRSMPSMSVQYYGFNVGRPPFDDVRVRRAFALAIDKRELVDSTLRNMAVPAMHGLVPPGSMGYPYGSVSTMPYDPDSARVLLKEAGYPDGVGFPPLALQVNNEGYRYLEVAEAVQEMLSTELHIGIALSVLPAPQHYARIESGNAFLWRAGWVADHPDPENFLALLDGRNIPRDSGRISGLNTTRYTSARFDSLFHAAGGMIDPGTRLQGLALAEAQAMHDVPLLPLYHERDVRLFQPYVRDLALNPLGQLDLSAVWFDRSVK
jgi:oligopeptide transport system substrate-binding protein